MSSQKWGDMIPQVRDDGSGGHAWFIGDQCIGSFGASAMVNTPGDEYPTRWAEDFPHMPARQDPHIVVGRRGAGEDHGPSRHLGCCAVRQPRGKP